MEKTLRSQTIALAGLLQAAQLVDQIANTGSAPKEYIAQSIHSLFAFDAQTVDAVFGGLYGVKLGLQLEAQILAGRSTENNQAIIRYCLAILYLQRKLSGDDERLAVLRSRLQHCAFKADHFSNDQRAICSSLASIYQDTISTFKFRIQVKGSLQQLQNPANADAIRALLLAGIRAAVLWRQAGGSRWDLLFRRGRMAAMAKSLLQEL